MSKPGPVVDHKFLKKFVHVFQLLLEFFATLVGIFPKKSKCTFVFAGSEDFYVDIIFFNRRCTFGT